MSLQVGSVGSKIESTESRQAASAVLIAVAGPVASGKSTVARALASRVGAVCIEADRVHDDLQAGGADEAERWRAFAPDFEARIYAELRRRGSTALASGRPVILDACFPMNIQRLEARSLARRSGVAFLFVECGASEQTIRRRLVTRDAEAPSTGWQTIHDNLEARWEAVTGLAADEYLRASCDGSVEEVVSRILTAPCLARARMNLVRARTRPMAVTFDCWNTLLYEADWKAAHGLRVDELKTAAREAGCDVSREAARRAFDIAWERHMESWREGVATGAHDVALWSLAELGLSNPQPAAFGHLIQLFEEMSHSGRVLALEGARQTLIALVRTGISCALVCDTGLTPGRVVRRHLETHGLLAPLTVQVFSDEVGVPKPDPRVFRAALDALDAEPEHTVHVGDLRRTDVAGARALGMTTVRIRDRHDDTSALAEADYVVGSHADLLALLGVDLPATKSATD